MRVLAALACVVTFEFLAFRSELNGTSFDEDQIL